MHSSSVEKAIAASKLSYMEKYGFAYENDLALLEKMLDAVIVYSPDRKTARVCCSGADITVKVRAGGEDLLENKSWKSWKKD